MRSMVLSLIELSTKMFTTTLNTSYWLWVGYSQKRAHSHMHGQRFYPIYINELLSLLSLLAHRYIH